MQIKEPDKETKSILTLMDMVIDNIPCKADISRPKEAKTMKIKLTKQERKKFFQLGGEKWLVEYLRKM